MTTAKAKSSAKVSKRKPPPLHPKAKGSKTRKLPVNRRPYYGDKPGAMVTWEHIPEPMFINALAECGGSRSQTARALGLTRSAVTKRIYANPHILSFVKEVEEYVGDMVVGNIVKLCEDMDGAMLRFYADRKLKDRGFGLKLDIEDHTPPDPLAAQKRAEAMKLVAAMIEERARLGLPPLFPRVAARTIEGALSAPPKAEEPIAGNGATPPKKPNGSNGHGNGHG